MSKLVLMFIVIFMIAGCEAVGQTKGSTTDDGKGNKTWDISGSGKTDVLELKEVTQ